MEQQTKVNCGYCSNYPLCKFYDPVAGILQANRRMLKDEYDNVWGLVASICKYFEENKK